MRLRWLLFAEISRFLPILPDDDQSKVKENDVKLMPSLVPIRKALAFLLVRKTNFPLLLHVFDSKIMLNALSVYCCLRIQISAKT
jgi:hypothetical protein